MVQFPIVMLLVLLENMAQLPVLLLLVLSITVQQCSAANAVSGVPTGVQITSTAPVTGDQIFEAKDHYTGKPKLRKLIVSENDDAPLTDLQKSELVSSCPGVMKFQKIEVLNFDIIHMDTSIMEGSKDVVQCARDWLHPFQKTGQVHLVVEDREMKPAMMVQSDEEIIEPEEAVQESEDTVEESEDTVEESEDLDEESEDTVEESEDMSASENLAVDVLIPGDPYYSSQWALKKNMGPAKNSPNTGNIKAPEAWELLRKEVDVFDPPHSPPTIVAVFDTGIRYDHEDLKDNMWVNTREIPNNGIDDDNNGYIDDIHGIDVVNQDGDPMDDIGHGTHVAGIIAATGNNGRGIAGVAGGLGLLKNSVQVMAIKIASLSNFLDGLAYALKYGARISNYSLVETPSGNPREEGSHYFNFWREIFTKVLKHYPDHIMTAPAGNDGREMDENEYFRSFYHDSSSDHDASNGSNAHSSTGQNGNSRRAGHLTIPCGLGLEYNVLCVTSTHRLDKLGKNANFGSSVVHIGAPGDHIVSTNIYDDRRRLNGAEFRRLYNQGPVYNHPLEKNILEYKRRGLFSGSNSGSTGGGGAPGPDLTDSFMMGGQQSSGIQSELDGTAKTKSYRVLSGTSFAAPHVTGLVVLLKRARPQLSAEEIKELVLNFSDQLSEAKISSGQIQQRRRLNLYRPLKEALARYPYMPRKPTTAVEAMWGILDDSNLTPGVISTVLKVRLRQDKCHGSNRQGHGGGTMFNGGGVVNFIATTKEGANIAENGANYKRRFDFKESFGFESDSIKLLEGRVQIWFLNDQKERIWTELHAERIFGGNESKQIDGDWTEDNIPITLELKSQPIPPEARYIAAFTVFVDLDSDENDENPDSDETTNPKQKEQSQKLLSIHPISSAYSKLIHKDHQEPPKDTQMLTAPLTQHAIVELKDKGDLNLENANLGKAGGKKDKWKQKQYSTSKVRIEYKWQNNDAIYSKSHDHPVEFGWYAEHLTDDQMSSPIFLPPYFNTKNVDRVISFLPPASGENEITHYNIYKGQWLPCDGQIYPNKEQKRKEFREMLKDSVNFQKKDTNKARLCWGYCLPRAVALVEGAWKDMVFPFWYSERLCSTRATEKMRVGDFIYFDNESKSYLGYGFELDEEAANEIKEINFKEGSFIKSIPAMKYLLPYCTLIEHQRGGPGGKNYGSKTGALVNKNKETQNKGAEGAEEDSEPPSDSFCKSLQLRTRTLSEAELVDDYKQESGIKPYRFHDKSSALWKRYGPAIHTTTKIEYEADLETLYSNLQRDSTAAESPSDSANRDSDRDKNKFYESAFITITGPGILTVDEFELPDEYTAGQNGVLAGVSLSYEDEKIKFGPGAYKSPDYNDHFSQSAADFFKDYESDSSEDAANNPIRSRLHEYPDITVPPGTHRIKWSFFFDMEIYNSDIQLKKEHGDHDGQKQPPKIKFKLNFHSTARYENIHVHVPDIKTFTDDDVEERWKRESAVEAGHDEDVYFIPSAIVIVPAYSNNLNYSGNMKGTLNENGENFKEVESLALANGIEIEPPPDLPPRNGVKETPPSDAGPDYKPWKAFIYETRGGLPREEFFEPKGGLLQIHQGSSVSQKVSTSLSSSYRNPNNKVAMKPDSVQFLDTNPEENAFAGRVKIIASMENIQSRRHNIPNYRWTCGGWGSGTHGAQIEGDLKHHLDCRKNQIRLTASLHWYDDHYTDESLSKLWVKKRKGMKNRDEEEDPDWMPNPVNRKQWNAWLYSNRRLESGENMVDILDIAEYKRDDSSFTSNIATGMLWQGGCYAEIPDSVFDSDLIASSEQDQISEDRIQVSSFPEEISCTIDMKPVKLDNVNRRNPKKWRLFTNERTVPTDIIGLPSLSTLIVPVYDVVVPSLPPGFFSPHGLDMFRVAGRDTGMNKQDAGSWDVMKVNMANVEGRHAVGLTGFRWYWENKNLMVKVADDKNINAIGNGENDNAITTMKVQKGEEFFAETMLPVVCPPAFSNADIILNEKNYWNSVSDQTTTSEWGPPHGSNYLDDNRRFSLSPGFPGCEVLGPFAPRCYSSEFYPQGSPFDSCTNGGWEITQVMPGHDTPDSDSEESDQFQEDQSIGSSFELTYRLKKTIKHENEHEWIYFPTAGRMALKDFHINEKIWDSVSFSSKGVDDFKKFKMHVADKLGEGSDPFSNGKRFTRFIDQPDASAFHFRSGVITEVVESTSDANSETKEQREEEENYFVIEWTPSLRHLNPLATLPGASGMQSQEDLKQMKKPYLGLREPLSLNLMGELMDQVVADQQTESMDGKIAADTVVVAQQTGKKEASGDDVDDQKPLDPSAEVLKHGHALFSDLMLDLAGSLRVVPVYHNYLNIKQSDSPNHSAVTHSIDTDVNHRYDVAAFRGPGASVSLNFSKIKGECKNIETASGETVREMTCKLPRRMTTNPKSGKPKDVVWRLKSVDESIRLRESFESGAEADLGSDEQTDEEPRTDDTGDESDFPNYCHLNDGNNSWTFPIDECGSSLHTAFDYATQKMKTFASILIVGDFGRKKKEPPVECRCEIKDDSESNEGSDEESADAESSDTESLEEKSSDAESSDDTEEKGKQDEDAETPGNRRLSGVDDIASPKDTPEKTPPLSQGHKSGHSVSHGHKIEI